MTANPLVSEEKKIELLVQFHTTLFGSNQTDAGLLRNLETKILDSLLLGKPLSGASSAVSATDADPGSNNVGRKY